MPDAPSIELDPPPAELAEPADTRWKLIRDVAVFQVKLAADALRDLALSPVSLVAAALDLLTRGEQPGRRFYDVVRTGRRTEEWINLFGADHSDKSFEEPSPASLDALVARVEELVVGDHERGGVSASVKNTVDRSLDAITGSRKRVD